MDELYEEFKKASTVKQLNALIQRISKIKFFDPASGSGNFLIITYKEIRLLEIKILQKITDLEPTPTFKRTSIQLSQFYGIEIDDFAHEMAILSLWLAEHQMNRVFEEMLFDYGKSKNILPLKEAGQITHVNATRENWNKACPITTDDEVYIIGNPPYLGARLQDSEQKKDMGVVFNGKKGYNNMDYIACWFYKAKDYIRGYNAKCALVTTNSICQGEQVALIWPNILSDEIEIGFAHQSFKWTNNAKGNAGVSVIIVGLRNISNSPKYIFTENFRKLAKNISPYLLDGPNTIVVGRSKPLSKFPEISFGSMANDGGHLLLSQQEKDELFHKEPESERLIKRLVGALEFIRGVKKYCLWIDDEQKEFANSLPLVRERIDKTEISRLNSKREATQKLSSIPHKFAEIRYLPTESILIPSVSSETRKYIPMGFLNPNEVIVAPNFAIYHAKPWRKKKKNVPNL